MNIEELQEGDFIEYIPGKLSIINPVLIALNKLINKEFKSKTHNNLLELNQDFPIQVITITKETLYEKKKFLLRIHGTIFNDQWFENNASLKVFLNECIVISTSYQRNIESQLKENQLLQSKLNSALSLIPAKPGMRIVKEIKFNTSIAFSYFIQYTHRDKTRALVERLDGSVTELELESFIFLT